MCGSQPENVLGRTPRSSEVGHAWESWSVTQQRALYSFQTFCGQRGKSWGLAIGRAENGGHCVENDTQKSAEALTTGAGEGASLDQQLWKCRQQAINIWDFGGLMPTCHNIDSLSMPTAVSLSAACY